MKPKPFGNPDPSEIIVIDDDQETPIKKTLKQSKTDSNTLWAKWNLLDHISDDESLPDVTNPKFNEFWENQAIGTSKPRNSIPLSIQLQLSPNQSSNNRFNRIENKELFTTTSMYIQVNCADF